MKILSKYPSVIVLAISIVLASATVLIFRFSNPSNWEFYLLILSPLSLFYLPGHPARFGVAVGAAFIFWLTFLYWFLIGMVIRFLFLLKKPIAISLSILFLLITVIIPIVWLLGAFH